MNLQEDITRKYREMNKIHSVMFEITHRCPCDCIHCFLVKNPADELTLDEIAALFIQLRQEGTINIGISGGEPFLRRDLPDILAAARKNGLFVDILTTGIFVGPAEARMLHSLGIYSTELSMLGSRPETHDAIMKYEGAFDRLLAAIQHLRKENIRVMIKTTIMRDNFQELEAMSDLCKSLGVEFSANLMIAPRFDGFTGPQEYMLGDGELSELDPVHIFGGLLPGEEMSGGAVLTCNAGRTISGISPAGDIYPCILLREKAGNIRDKSIHEIWHDNPANILLELRELRPEDVTTCHSCNVSSFCRRCPGATYMETGSIKAAPPSACRCARGIKEIFDHKKSH